MYGEGISKTGEIIDLGVEHEIIEKSGFVKKSKYQNLKDLVDDLEKRISQLEKD